MRIVYVGETHFGSRTPQRMAALRRLGHEVVPVSTTVPGWTYETPPALLDRALHRLRLPRDPAGANRALIAAATAGCDGIWIEAARMIRPETLRRAKELCPGAWLAWYSEDDMTNPAHLSRWLAASLPLFDLWITTKSFNARPEEMPSLGVRDVLFVNNSYDPGVHRPPETPPDPSLIADVGFIGTYEAPRARSLLHLAESGIAVRIFGNGWTGLIGRHPCLNVEGKAIYGDGFVGAIAATRVNLCFLRKGNRDLQTCRSIEIPACGGFMLHERNPEILGLFAENREAAYFGDDRELAAQCRHWLEAESERRKIARAGYERTRAARLSHDDMMNIALGRLGTIRR